MKSKIKIDNKNEAFERPYYVVDDNEKSIVEIHNETKYKSIENNSINSETKDKINNLNYLDTAYLSKQFKGSKKI